MNFARRYCEQLTHETRDRLAWAALEAHAEQSVVAFYEPATLAALYADPDKRPRFWQLLGVLSAPQLVTQAIAYTAWLAEQGTVVRGGWQAVLATWQRRIR